MKEGGGARSGEGRQQWRSLAALSARGITAKWPTQSCFFLFLLPLFPILISSHVSAALYTWKWAASNGGACKGLKVTKRWGVTASAASLPSTAPVSSLLPVGIGLIGGVDTSMEMSSLCLMKWVEGMHFFFYSNFTCRFLQPHSDFALAFPGCRRYEPWETSSLATPIQVYAHHVCCWYFHDKLDSQLLLLTVYCYY